MSLRALLSVHSGAITKNPFKIGSKVTIYLPAYPRPCATNEAQQLSPLQYFEFKNNLIKMVTYSIHSDTTSGISNLSSLHLLKVTQLLNYIVMFFSNTSPIGGPEVNGPWK